MLATATLPLSSSQIICTEITTSIFPLSLKSGTSSYFLEFWSASSNAARITDPDFKLQFVFKNTGFSWSLACAASEAKVTDKVRSNVLISMASLSAPDAGTHGPTIILVNRQSPRAPEANVRMVGVTSRLHSLTYDKILQACGACPEPSQH